MRNNPLKQNDVDKIIKLSKEKTAQNEKNQRKKSKQHRRTNRPQLEILPLNDAIKRLSDPKVWAKASKGFRF